MGNKPEDFAPSDLFESKGVINVSATATLPASNPITPRNTQTKLDKQDVKSATGSTFSKRLEQLISSKQYMAAVDLIVRHWEAGPVEPQLIRQGDSESPVELQLPSQVLHPEEQRQDVREELCGWCSRELRRTILDISALKETSTVSPNLHCGPPGETNQPQPDVLQKLTLTVWHLSADAAGAWKVILTSFEDKPNVLASQLNPAAFDEEALRWEAALSVVEDESPPRVLCGLCRSTSRPPPPFTPRSDAHQGAVILLQSVSTRSLALLKAVLPALAALPAPPPADAWAHLFAAPVAHACSAWLAWLCRPQPAAVPPSPKNCQQGPQEGWVALEADPEAPGSDLRLGTVLQGACRAYRWLTEYVEAVDSEVVAATPWPAVTRQALTAALTHHGSKPFDDLPPSLGAHTSSTLVADIQSLLAPSLNLLATTGGEPSTTALDDKQGSHAEGGCSAPASGGGPRGVGLAAVAMVWGQQGKAVQDVCWRGGGGVAADEAPVQSARPPLVDERSHRVFSALWQRLQELPTLPPPLRPQLLGGAIAALQLLMDRLQASMLPLAHQPSARSCYLHVSAAACVALHLAHVGTLMGPEASPEALEKLEEAGQRAAALQGRLHGHAVSLHTELVRGAVLGEVAACKWAHFRKPLMRAAAAGPAVRMWRLMLHGAAHRAVACCPPRAAAAVLTAMLAADAAAIAAAYAALAPSLQWRARFAADVAHFTETCYALRGPLQNDYGCISVSQSVTAELGAMCCRLCTRAGLLTCEPALLAAGLERQAELHQEEQGGWAWLEGTSCAQLCPAGPHLGGAFNVHASADVADTWAAPSAAAWRQLLDGLAAAASAQELREALARRWELQDEVEGLPYTDVEKADRLTVQGLAQTMGVSSYTTSADAAV